MSGPDRTPPLYDRRRLEALVMAHRLRVHLAQKREGLHKPQHAGVKAPR